MRLRLRVGGPGGPCHLGRCGSGLGLVIASGSGLLLAARLGGAAGRVLAVLVAVAVVVAGSV